MTTPPPKSYSTKPNNWQTKRLDSGIQHLPQDRAKPKLFSLPHPTPRGEGGGQTQANNKNRLHEVIVKPSEISCLTSTKDGKTVIKEEYQKSISLEKRGRAYTLKWHTNIPHDQMPEEDRQQLFAAINETTAKLEQIKRQIQTNLEIISRD